MTLDEALGSTAYSFRADIYLDRVNWGPVFSLDTY